MGRFRRRGNDDDDSKRKDDKSSSGRQSFGRGSNKDDAKKDDGNKKGRSPFGRGRSGDDESRAKPSGRGAFGRRGDDRNASQGGTRNTFGRNRSVASSSGDPGGRSPFGRRGNDDDKDDDSGGRRSFGRSTGSSPSTSSSGRTPFGRRGNDDDKDDDSGGRRSFGRSTGSSPSTPSSGRSPFGRRGGDDDDKDDASSGRSTFGRGSPASPSTPSRSTGERTSFGGRDSSSGSTGSFGRGSPSSPSTPSRSTGERTSFGGRSTSDDKDDSSSGRSTFGRGSPASPSTPSRSTGERTSFGGRDSSSSSGSTGSFGRSTSPSTPSRSTGERSSSGSTGTFGRSSPSTSKRSTGERGATGGRSTGTFGRSSSPSTSKRSTGERDSKKDQGGGRRLFGRGGSKSDDKPARAKKDGSKEKKPRFGGAFSRGDGKDKPAKTSTRAERRATPTREKPAKAAKPAKTSRSRSKAKALPKEERLPRNVTQGWTLDRKLDVLGWSMIIGALLSTAGWLQTTFSTSAEAQGGLAQLDEQLAWLLGTGRIALVFALAYVGGWLVLRHFGRDFNIDYNRIAGATLLFASFITTLHWWNLFFIDFLSFEVNYVPTKEILYAQSEALAQSGGGGGVFGDLFYTLIHSWFADIGTEVFLFGIMWGFGILLGFELSFEKVANKVIAWRESRRARRAVEAVPAMVTATAAAGASGGSSNASSRRQKKDKGTTRKVAEVEGRTQAPSDAPITADTDGDAPKRRGRGLLGRRRAPDDAPITADTDGDAPKRRGRGIFGRRKAPDDAVAENNKPAVAASVATDEAEDKPQRQGLAEKTGRTAKATPEQKSDEDATPKRRGLNKRKGRNQSDTDDKSDNGDESKGRGRGLFGRRKAAPDDVKTETPSRKSADKAPERADAAASIPLSRRLPDQKDAGVPERTARTPEVVASAAVSAAAITKSDEAGDDKPSQTERRPSGGLSDRLSSSRRPSVTARQPADANGDGDSDSSQRGFPARRPSVTSTFGRQSNDPEASDGNAESSASPMRSGSRDSGILGRRSQVSAGDTVPSQSTQDNQDQPTEAVETSNGKAEAGDTQSLERTSPIEQTARPTGLPSRRSSLSESSDAEATPEGATARRSPFAARASVSAPAESGDTGSSIFRRRTIADAPPTDLPGRRTSSASPSEDLGTRDNPFARSRNVEAPASSDNGDADDKEDAPTDRLAALVQRTANREENGKSESDDKRPSDDTVNKDAKSQTPDVADAARIAVEGAAMAQTGILGRRQVETDDAAASDQPARPRGLRRPDSEDTSSSDMLRRQRNDLLSRRQVDEDDKDDQPQDTRATVSEETIAMPPIGDKVESKVDGKEPSAEQLQTAKVVSVKSSKDDKDSDKPEVKADKVSSAVAEKSEDAAIKDKVEETKSSVSAKEEDSKSSDDDKKASKSKEKTKAKDKTEDKKAADPEVSAGPRWSKPEFITLLEEGSEQEIDQQYLLERARLIEDTLGSFGAPGRVVEVNTGPVITQFGVEPDYIERRGGSRSRVKVSAIAGLDKDLALALAAKSIRIQAPVPGKGFVGIEVPNAESDLVSLRDVMNSKAHEKQVEKSTLTIGLGKRVDGGTVSADLTEMPHLLIAGATGSGKSVCVNAIIACLLLQNTPDDLQFIMVDPKRVELAGYNGIPHLVAPVVVDLERIVGVLKWVQREMDDRYRRFAAIGARNIADYNQKRASDIPKMPYLVVIVDELADLMMLAPDETERLIARLAQMARATGIHLIISTQRPSVDVVTGLIKANFPARIAFAVASSVDSRVILDQPGAEKLLGRGDMLYQAPDAPAPLRMQGVYVSDPEINRITHYWKSTHALSRKDGHPELPLDPPKDRTKETPALPRIISRSERINTGEGEKVASASPVPRPPLAQRQQDFWQQVKEVENEDEENGNGEGDELYDEAVDVVRTRQRASISMLQRTFRIGYTRAARLIDIMEENGVVGPAESGAKPRKVLLPPPEDD